MALYYDIQSQLTQRLFYISFSSLVIIIVVANFSSHIKVSENGTNFTSI